MNIRRIISSSLQSIILTVTALSLASCGRGTDLEKLGTDVGAVSARIEHLTKGSPEAVGAFSLKLADTAVNAQATIQPGIFDLKLLGSDLTDFAVAAYLHANAGDTLVIDAVNGMAKAERPLYIALTQGDCQFSRSLGPSRLKTLYKESLANLNRSAAAADAARLTGSWAEKVFRTEGATEFECVYSTNQIIINVTYPDADASPLKGVSNPTPALKGMLVEAAEAHYARYGLLRPAITQLMTDLGVKELRLTYKYSDGKPAPSVRLEWGKDL